MKPQPAKLVVLHVVSPVRDALLGSIVLSSRKSYGCQHAGHTDASSPNEASLDPGSQQESLAKGIASLPDPVAPTVKVYPGEVDGDAAIEIPLPSGGIARIGFFQSLGESKPVVLCQSDPEDEPTDVSRTINPTGLDLRLDEIYSRLCAFVGGESSTPTTRKPSPADNPGKSNAVPTKGSAGGRKQSGKSSPAKKKVRRARSHRHNGKPKHKSRKRKHKKGKR